MAKRVETLVVLVMIPCFRNKKRAPISPCFHPLLLDACTCTSSGVCTALGSWFSSLSQRKMEAGSETARGCLAESHPTSCLASPVKGLPSSPRCSLPCLPSRQISQYKAKSLLRKTEAIALGPTHNRHGQLTHYSHCCINLSSL